MLRLSPGLLAAQRKPLMFITRPAPPSRLHLLPEFVTEGECGRVSILDTTRPDTMLVEVPAR